MVKPTDTRESDDLAEVPRLDHARDRRIAVEAHVRAVLVVVGGVLAHLVTGESEQPIGYAGPLPCWPPTPQTPPETSIWPGQVGIRRCAASPRASATV